MKVVKWVVENNNECYTIDRNDVHKINCSKTFKVELVKPGSLENYLLKRKILGVNTEHLKENIYVLDKKLEVVMLTDKKIKINTKPIFEFSDFHEIYLDNLVLDDKLGTTNLLTVGYKVHKLNLQGFEIGNTRTLEHLISGVNLMEINLSGLDTHKVTDIKYMFSKNYSLTNIIGINTLDFSKVVNTNSTFRECGSLKEINLSSTGLSTIKEANFMFADCKSLRSVDLACVTDIKRGYLMFSGCDKLEYVNFNNIKNIAKLLRKLNMRHGIKVLNKGKLIST